MATKQTQPSTETKPGTGTPPPAAQPAPAATPPADPHAIPTVQIRKNTAIVTINEADLPQWTAKGFSLIKPEPPAPPAPNGNGQGPSA